MTTGTVKWFNSAKGFGFINSECGTMDIFVHYSAIVKADGEFPDLDEGEKVTFELTTGPKGPQAFKVNRAPKQSEAIK